MADSAFVVRSLNNLGLVHTDLGRFDLARAELDQARAISASRGDSIVEVSAAINRGKLELEIGDPRAAMTWLESARVRSAALRYYVGEEKHSRPYYWAAYVVSGSGRMTASRLAVGREK